MNPLNDTFEVHEELGQGGFGTVYRATRRATGEEVALKRLKPRPELGEEHSQQLFLNGARLAKKFDLEGFVKILEVDVEPFSGPFIVMELLRGETLYQRLCTRPLAAVEALEVLFDIATIVSRAHKRGVVHRDLKPSNIMLCKDGLCKDGVRVLDLGMATLVAEARTKSFETLSSMMRFVGSPGYIAPETVRQSGTGQRQASPQVDVYAWGLMLYECLTGTPAIKSKGAVRMLAEHLQPGPIPIPEVWARTPVGPLLAQTMAKAPEARLYSAVDILKQMELLFEDRSWLTNVENAMTEHGEMEDMDTLPPMG